MNTTKMEFAVEMTCQKCVDDVGKALSGIDGVKNVDISLDRGTVIVDTDLSYSLIQGKIESSGRRAVLKGYGDSPISAVSMMSENSSCSIGDTVRGVVRFVQSAAGCVVDGTIDGLSPGLHGLHIHECGDISRGCASVGEHYNPHNAVHGGPDDELLYRHVGDLGNIIADEKGRATFRLKDEYLNVPEIIGRSLVITENPDDLGRGDSVVSKIDGNSEIRWKRSFHLGLVFDKRLDLNIKLVIVQELACGIIARSPGIFQNTKKICACDGLTLWDERDKTLSKQHMQSASNP